MADITGRPDTTADPLIGRVIGNYIIQERLGRGGMGSVYKAEHQLIGKKVAIKVLLKEFAGNELLVQRFFNEARAVNKIGHDNIVDISDYGKTDDGWIYYVMELLEGRELTKLIKELTQVPLPRAIHIIRQCAFALDACHKQGIIHRDLKPDNIFLITHGGREDFVKVLDFGVAKLANEETGYTRQGAVLGTPHYMSPEQAEGRPVDQRTDVYALGIILYRMLTGKVPFPGTTFSAVIVKVLTEPPRPPRALKPDLPAALDAVVLKSIAKDPNQRYGSTLEFLEALEKAANLDPLAQEAMASSMKVTNTPSSVRLNARAETSPSQVTAAGEVMSKSKSVSWADGLPRLPDETLNGARTQSGTMPAPQQQPSNSSMPWLVVGISVGVAMALGGASLVVWLFVIKPGQLNNQNNNTNQPQTSLAANPTQPDKPKITPPTNPTPNPVSSPASKSNVETPTPAPGLMIESDPVGAAVHQGKLALGFTPLPLTPPTAVETFTLSAPGYEPGELAFDPAKPGPLKATLVKTQLDDKSFTKYFQSLNGVKDPESFAEIIDPAGLHFYRSGSGDGKIFSKDKTIDVAGLEARPKDPMVMITRDQLSKDKKLFQQVKSGLGSYYDDFEDTSYPWSCNLAELFCIERLPTDGGGTAYSKAVFIDQGGLYLSQLIIFTNPQ